MARLTIYVPDDLLAQVKASDLNYSQVAQEAFRTALAATALDRWLDSLELESPSWASSDAAQRALREVREENG